MSSAAVAIIDRARAAGVRLMASPSGRLAYEGPEQAFARFKPMLAANRDAIVAALAQQGVERIYADMAARAAERESWWTKPVEGWPDHLVIENVVTGKRTLIVLRGERAHD